MGRIVVPRRTVLKGLGATGLVGCGPPGSGTVPVVPGTIDTVVICMMENRSFDHVFGSLSLLEGRTDVDGLVQGMSNPDLDGVEIPIARLGVPCTEPDPPHGWTSSRTQLDDGTCRGFVRAYLESGGPDAPPGNVMAYQTREDQPVSYALADAYALCQRWFSSVLSSTWPNRLYFHAAQSEGVTSNDFPPGGYSARTLWDQLTDAGIEWGYYFTDLPTLALFGDRGWGERLQFMDAFFDDAAAGRLPNVVCVDAGAGYNDDHPPHHPLLGQLFLGSVYAALAASPHWERCLFIVTYDEAGGFFDHVAPGLIADDYADLGFDQLGFRVPSFVAGPYVKNVVSNDMFEHASALRLVQDLFGIDERLTLRNEITGDLSSVLDWDAMAEGRPAAPIVLPKISRSEAEIAAECAKLGQRTGQPELRAVVREVLPHLDRTSALPTAARRTWERAADLGLWIPR